MKAGKGKSDIYFSPCKYFHKLSKLNSDSPLTCSGSAIYKPIHHEAELLDDKCLSLLSVHTSTE